ncbi:MAG: YIEGIA family protein [Halanaerobiales bacterium]
MFKYSEMFFLSFLLGTIARAFMLRIDYRQFPSFPHSYVIHLTMGLIASALGALAFPVLLEEEYIAITFLTIGAQHFREVRNLERDSLEKLEKDELVPKGSAYIEGIAKLFEARNYLALITSLSTSIIYFYLDWLLALIGGTLIAYFLHYLMKGPKVCDIAKVEVVPINFEGANIGIKNTIMMNIGEKEALKKWKSEGIGIKITPQDENARATLFNLGQRQTIIHDLSILMGIKMDKGLQQYTPLARLQSDEGTLNIIILPQEPDPEFIKMAVEKIPIVESAQRKPLKNPAGLKAAD